MLSLYRDLLDWLTWRRHRAARAWINTLCRVPRCRACGRPLCR